MGLIDDLLLNITDELKKRDMGYIFDPIIDTIKPYLMYIISIITLIFIMQFVILIAICSHI